MARSNRRAFTLIELLVVIAIIAILAAILFPVFARARAQSYATGCASNMNQEMKAFLMYTDDNGQKCVLTYWPGSNAVNAAPGCMLPGAPGRPWRTCDSVGSSQVPGWPYLLDVYRKSFEVLRCPAGGDDFNIYSSTSPYYWWFNWGRFAQHGMNWVYMCPTPYPASPAGIQAPRKLNLFQVPADTISFVDSRINVGSATSPTWKRGYIVSDPPTGGEATNFGGVYWYGGWSSVSPDPRHSDKCNVTMLDSHVKRYSIDTINHDERWDFTDN
jgi:prepilin-type N-terminal cleavage/methylation domain-containing protein/prepilin-type processing-associated H-X9-DG protein